MTAVAVIPARYASSRFPGKPLAPIDGLPMIQHVWEGTRRAKALHSVVIATDDPRIAEVCRGFGAEVALTHGDHPTGTHRVCEAAAGLEADIVVNVQGDEPLIEGFVVDAAVAALREDPGAPVATVVHPVDPNATADPNRVKAVLDQRDRALYFSRAAIPYVREGGVSPRTLWQHVGLYAYRHAFLRELVELPPTPAEGAEGLEQLRVLEHGYPIRCARIDGWHSIPVDVPGDIPAVEAERARRARA